MIVEPARAVLRALTGTSPGDRFYRTSPPNGFPPHSGAGARGWGRPELADHRGDAPRNLTLCHPYYVAGVELRHFSLERYKGYARRAEVELAPLTILVGPNNSGKTALAQAVPLLAGGLSPSDAYAREPLPLVSCGIRHGDTFEDLVTGRVVHGRLRLSITLGDENGESSLSATVTNVVAPGRTPERQISDWRLQSNDREIATERQGFGETSEPLAKTMFGRVSA